METLTAWMAPGLDVVSVALLAAVLWRLGRDPGAAWSERETRLQAIFDELRALVAQSEGLARDLDAKLGQREERLQALLRTAEAAAPPALARGDRGAAVRDASAAATDGRDDDPAAVARRIEALADAGTAVEEIARRVGVAPAEVRLVIGLKSARAARQRVAEERASA
jgi:hypothetical protein